MATSKKGGWSDTAAPLANPFAALAALRPETPGSEKPQQQPEQPKQAALPARAVVSVERKGRGGKTVTLVSHLGLPHDELDRWTADMKRSLGCGGAREDDAIALQGDQRERAVDWLTRKGIRKVSG